MNVLVLGQRGQLASELQQRNWPPGVTPHAVGREQADLTDSTQLRDLLHSKPWQLIINAAAYTAVDLAESERDQAFVLNRDLPAALALFGAQSGVPLIHISTDYVFDGTKSQPYREDDPIAPINCYGESKAAGEQEIRRNLTEHVILRTSWLYSSHGKNFVKSMMRLAQQRDELRIVNDQHGCPTSAADLAEAVCSIAGRITGGGDVPWGTYHYAGAGETTWLGLAEATLREYESCGGKLPGLIGIPTSEYPTPARRPANSRLDCSKITEQFGIETHSWQSSCAAVVRACSAQEAEVTQ